MLRTRPEITSAFSISSSGRLWPFLNREILNVGSLRLRFRSIDHDQIQPKSERIPSELISGRVLSEHVNIGLGRMMSDRGAGLTFIDVTVTNTSAQTISGPLQLILEEISSPDITLSNADGQTSDGKDYLYLTDENGDGVFDPGERIMVRLHFVNPFRRRFTFELGVWGML